MKLNNFSKLLLSAFVMVCLASSCVKEGPMGLTGATGANGKDGVDGKDANETCKACHTSTKVDLISTQFQFSKHEYGEAAFEESGNTGCTPCHAQEAFKDVVARNVSSGFTLGTNGKYTLDYATTSDKAYGEIGCSTCHSSLHTTYGTADLAFTTVKPVPMVMWGGKKTIDLKADGGKSNLCVKCHQPRPQTNLQTGNVQDYASLVAKPTALAYDANSNTATTNIIRPSYRMHVHYGSVGAVYAGMGGVEFGTGYTNSKHTEVASCADCHMGTMVGRAGGHTFNAVGKFDGCNVVGCHSTAPISSATTTKYWKQTRDDVKLLLAQLAAKLTVGGVEIMNRSNDPEGNLWYGLTTNNYDGYLNVFDPDLNNPKLGLSTYANATGPFQNPAAPTTPNATWSKEEIDFNASLPKLSLTNAQYGAILNFQLVLRDYSLGIHNTAYTMTLLKNSIAVLP